ncbi:hypothetical protein AB4Y85_03930 [Microvirga sp. 2YAF29]|uniref:hypothetical protein n=1 Tax=Microvirga sp. 2YAF29 TaxID=3233031 RepID=UPI003F9E0E35
MEDIIIVALIALLVSLVLHDIIRFVRAVGSGAVWTFLLGFGLPCAAIASLLVWLALPEIGWDAAPLIRGAALTKP